MLTEFKIHLTIQYCIFKRYIDKKAKQKGYYNHLPKFVADGFTLAEVLITLTIVGVIASMTIPTMVNNVNTTINVIQLKKTYSNLQQAFMLLQADNGGSIVPIFTNDTIGTNSMNAFLTKLNYIKNCGSGWGCWYDSPLYLLNGSAYKDSIETHWNGTRGKAILANGTMIKIWIASTTCTHVIGTGPLSNVCGEIGVDLNGANAPNTGGRDYFDFWVTQTGVYPDGIDGDPQRCNVSPGDGNNTWGCTAKVLSEGAINY